MPSWFLNVASRRDFSIWKPSDVNQHLTCFLKSTQARTFCALSLKNSQRTFIISGLVDWYIESKWQLSDACLVRVRGFHSQLQRLSPPRQHVAMTTLDCSDESAGTTWVPRWPRDDPNMLLTSCFSPIPRWNPSIQWQVGGHDLEHGSNGWVAQW